MRLYFCRVSDNESRLSWSSTPKDDPWVEIEREPTPCETVEIIENPDYGKILSEERIAPDEINQVIDDRPYIAVLHPQEPTGEELEAEAIQERRARIMEALADILLEAEDPEDLVRRIKEVRDAPPEA